MLFNNRCLFLLIVCCLLSMPLMAVRLVDRIKEGASLEEIEEIVKNCANSSARATSALIMLANDESLTNEIIDLLIKYAGEKELQNSFYKSRCENVYLREQVDLKLFAEQRNQEGEDHGGNIAAIARPMSNDWAAEARRIDESAENYLAAHPEIQEDIKTHFSHKNHSFFSYLTCLGICAGVIGIVYYIYTKSPSALRTQTGGHAKN